MCVYRCSLCLSLVGSYVIGGLDGIYDGAEGYRTDAFLGDIVLLIFGAVEMTGSIAAGVIGQLFFCIHLDGF